MEITLRNYQKACVEAFFRELRLRRKNHLFILPTGAGKTIVFSNVAKRLNLRTLILGHRDELLKQAASKLRLVWREADVGIIKGQTNEINHQVLIGSNQTLMNSKRLAMLPPIELVIVDECHHYVSDKNRDLLLKIIGPKTIVLGVTATPNRADQRALGELFADNPEQGPDYERSMLEMISEGYLCPITGINGNLNVELSGVTVTAGDYQMGSLSRVMNTPSVNRAMYKFWAKYAKDRKTIVFATDVQHAFDLAREFQRHNTNVGVITGSLPDKKREQLLQDFAEGRIQVMLNIGVLSEGFDEPSVSCILFARPTKSASLYIQMVGRGLRLYPGKKDCLVLDAVKNTKSHSLVNIPNLFPKPKPPRDRNTELQQKEDEKQDDVFHVGRAWFEAQSSQVYSSNFEWELLNDGNFRLRLIKAEILLKKTPQGWFPIYSENGTEQYLYDEPLSVEYALGIAEEKIKRLQFGRFARKDAAWRSREATDNQKEALKKWGIAVPEKLTAGEADKLLREAIDRKRSKK